MYATAHKTHVSLKCRVQNMGVVHVAMADCSMGVQKLVGKEVGIDFEQVEGDLH